MSSARAPGFLFIAVLAACSGDGGDPASPDADAGGDRGGSPDADPGDGPGPAVQVSGTLGGDSVAGFDTALVVSFEGTSWGVSLGRELSCDDAQEEAEDLVLILGTCRYEGIITEIAAITEDCAGGTGAFALVERMGADAETASAGTIEFTVDGDTVTAEFELEFGADTVSGSATADIVCSL